MPQNTIIVTKPNTLSVNTEIDWQRVARFSIGSDPELIFEYEGNHIPANVALEDDEDGYIEDDCGMGTDGHCETGEIRPDYAYTPLDHVRNIQRLFKNACETFPTITELKWLAGSYKHNEPIGGHIHFGIDIDEWNRRNLTTALDVYLSCNLMQIEIATEARERKENYGTLGGIREQDWGTEYRSPSSWIYSPATALAVLSLAKHIVNQSCIDNDFFVDLDVRSVFGMNYNSVSERYRRHDTEFFRTHREKLWADIESWPVDPEVKDGLEIFKTMLEKNHRFGFGDFKRHWGLNIEKNTPAKATGITFSEIFGG